MSSINEFKIYKHRDSITGEMFDRLNCIDCNQYIFDRVLNIKFYFSNGEMYIIDQVSSFNFDLNKEINIESILFVPSIYNMKFEPCFINRLVIDARLVDVYDTDKLLYATTEFSNLNIFNITGGFNTDSCMRITLRFNHMESL